MSQEAQQQAFEFDTRPTIKGFPELRWTGKRPYESTLYYPAQLRERYGCAHQGGEHDGWLNKIYWGDNLQVMSHLLAEYRGQVDLIYIDPPFDSKADYKKRIKLRDKQVSNDSSSFEEKQYGDIWTNDEYLQFMYERLILCRELLSDTGSIYVHCDWRKSHHLRMILDEVFGPENFLNEISWLYKTGGASKRTWARKHDTLLFYSKRLDMHTFNPQKERSYMMHKYGFKKSDFQIDPDTGLQYSMVYVRDVWDLPSVGSATSERTDYPTQKPEPLLERIITASSNPGDIVFDCFMGSGTAQAVAMKLGRRFIGADINLGAVQTTTKRLIGIQQDLDAEATKTASALAIEAAEGNEPKFSGFEVYNVNNYDFFRNPLEAKALLMEALEVQPFEQSNVWDGELDGRMVKMMPVNRIATKADLEELKANLPYKTYEKRKDSVPGKPVECITLVCMGHEPDLKYALEEALSDYIVDVEVVDILRDRKDLQLKRAAEAEVVREGGKLVVRSFYPLNLMQKLSLQREYVEDWRQLVESVMIDWNFDGVVLEPNLIDLPDEKEFVSGIYDIPTDAGTIKVKITDVLSESFEVEVN